MTAIGHIVRLQVQRSTLKLLSPPGLAHWRYYDPAALLEVPRLELTAEGVLGLADEGDSVVDVHHVRHAASKNADGVNALSVGFTSHYVSMRERFGTHLLDGIAGENVVVAASEHIALDRLAGGLDVALQGGGRAHLEHVIAAEPCIEFTRYALRLGPSEPSGEACAQGLRFLRYGMRGFYVRYAGKPVVLNVGDVVFADC